MNNLPASCKENYLHDAVILKLFFTPTTQREGYFPDPCTDLADQIRRLAVLGDLVHNSAPDHATVRFRCDLLGLLRIRDAEADHDGQISVRADFCRCLFCLRRASRKEPWADVQTKTGGKLIPPVMFKLMSSLAD